MTPFVNPKRCEVLNLYRKILRTGRDWVGHPEDNAYIQNEARRLFRKNKDITDLKKIDEKIFEAESRYELGVHYHIPYPRLYQVPTGSKVASTKHLDDLAEVPEDVDPRLKPAYMASYDTYEDLEKKRQEEEQQEQEERARRKINFESDF